MGRGVYSSDLRKQKASENSNALRTTERVFKCTGYRAGQPEDNFRMDPSIDRIFLDCSSRRLKQSLARIEDCLRRLDDETVWTRGGSNENAVGNLVLHLCGNLLQWILAGIAGAPNERDRDAEFAARGGAGTNELAERIGTTVREAAEVIDGLPESRLGERLRIQGYEVTVLEAIYHTVEHLAQHTGQIILLTKLFTGRGTNFYGHLRGAAVHAEKTP